MALSLEEIRWVAALARLDMTDEELQAMADQLGAIKDYVDQLQEVNTERVQPLAHPMPIHNVFRGDEQAPSLPVDEALANAPARHDDFFSVPAVFDS